MPAERPPAGIYMDRLKGSPHGREHHLVLVKLIAAQHERIRPLRATAGQVVGRREPLRSCRTASPGRWAGARAEPAACVWPDDEDARPGSKSQILRGKPLAAVNRSEFCGNRYRALNAVPSARTGRGSAISPAGARKTLVGSLTSTPTILGRRKRACFNSSSPGRQAANARPRSNGAPRAKDGLYACLHVPMSASLLDTDLLTGLADPSRRRRQHAVLLDKGSTEVKARALRDGRIPVDVGVCVEELHLSSPSTGSGFRAARAARRIPALVKRGGGRRLHLAAVVPAGAKLNHEKRDE